MVNVKDNVDKNVSLVDWSEEALQVGTPTMVMLSPRNYYFKVLKDKHKLTISRKGVYNEIDPDYFSKDDGEFNLLDESNMVMYLPAVTKVLFAEKKYPMLAANQLFAPLALVFNEDTVDILGQVLEMVTPPKDYSKEEDDSIKTV